MPFKKKNSSFTSSEKNKCKMSFGPLQQAATAKQSLPCAKKICCKPATFAFPLFSSSESASCCLRLVCLFQKAFFVTFPSKKRREIGGRAREDFAAVRQKKGNEAVFRRRGGKGRLDGTRGKG